MGIAILLVSIAYIIISLVVLVIVISFAPGKKWKCISGLLVIVTSILIPTWDIPIGIINFQHLCESKAGEFIYKTVPLGEEYYLKAGERDLRYQGNSKFAYTKGGELNLEKVKQNYIIDTAFDRNYSRWGHIYKRETIIMNKKNNEIIGRAVSFYYRSGWLISGLMDQRAGQNVCPTNGLPASKNYIHTTLIDKTFYEDNKR